MHKPFGIQSLFEREYAVILIYFLAKLQILYRFLTTMRIQFQGDLFSVNFSLKNNLVVVYWLY